MSDLTGRGRGEELALSPFLLDFQWHRLARPTFCWDDFYCLNFLRNFIARVFNLFIFIVKVDSTLGYLKS